MRPVLSQGRFELVRQTELFDGCKNNSDNLHFLDGTGYVDDGREIFDDDLEDEPTG